MNVFAYIDRSSFAPSVCLHAAWAARQLGLRVEIIHAIDLPTSQSRDYSGYFAIDAAETALEDRVRSDEAHNRELIEDGRSLLVTAADAVHEAGVSSVDQRLFQGTVIEHLEQHHREAALVVIGQRGEGAKDRRRHLGHQVERIVRSAHRPVLIAAPTFTPIERALIAWDAGRSSSQATQFLTTTPVLAGVDVTLLHVARDTTNPPPGLADVVTQLASTGLTVESDIREGAVASTILDIISSLPADLIVMGAYGHSHIREMIVGSTTTEVLMQTQVPVLVFH